MSILVALVAAQLLMVAANIDEPPYRTFPKITTDEFADVVAHVIHPMYIQFCKANGTDMLESAFLAGKTKGFHDFMVFLVKGCEFLANHKWPQLDYFVIMNATEPEWRKMGPPEPIDHKEDENKEKTNSESA